MYLKELLVLVLLVSFGTGALAQTDVKKNIESDFNQFISLYIQKDFEKALNYVVPEFVDHFSKEKYVAILEDRYKNPELEMGLSDAKILDIEEPVNIEDINYSLITYTCMLNLKLPVRENETPQKKRLRISTMKNNFAEWYGSGKVTFDEETQLFHIEQEKHVYAISKLKTGWKFLEVDDKDNQNLYKEILPPAAYDKIKIEETPEGTTN